MASKRLIKNVSIAARQLSFSLDERSEEHKQYLLETIKDLERQIILLVAKLPDKTDKVAASIRIKQLSDIKKQISTLFRRSYRNWRNDLDTATAKAAKDIHENLTALNVPAGFTSRDRGLIQALQETNFDQYRNLGETFRRNIMQSLFQAVIGSRSRVDIAKTVSGLLVGVKDRRGRPMSSHAKTIAQDAVMNFARSYHTQKAEELDLTWFLYVGTTILDSRPFCVARAGKVFSSKDVEEWEGMTWAGKNPNLPVKVALGGYNCRHHLQPMSKTIAKVIMAEQAQEEKANKKKKKTK